jgi:hypothetical protein
MCYVNFYGYQVQRDTLRKSQMVLAQANRELDSGNIDAWFFAGCPIGRGYAKWKAAR